MAKLANMTAKHCPSPSHLVKVPRLLILSLETARAQAAISKAVDLPSRNRAWYLVHPEVAQVTACHLVNSLTGTVRHAVMANPDARLLHALNQGRVRCFDVASIAEIHHLQRTLPTPRLCFMHPVKSEEAIEGACVRRGVEVLAAGSEQKLVKIETLILQHLQMKKCLAVRVRIAVARGSAEIDLSDRFGADVQTAVKVLQRASELHLKLGITVRVGSQCTGPNDFARAARLANSIPDRAGVTLQLLDLGLPVEYVSQVRPPQDFFSVIAATIPTLSRVSTAELLIEPGRALAASSADLIARVVGR